MKILDNFRLGYEKEDFQKVNDSIRSGIQFRGTNLWILIFAIFIASLGLNVNSTAVIIGAMLISPIMGPIMGLGFGMAINDILLIRRSAYSYLFAAMVGLLTSSVYFLITPLSDAHSEILARISPNIYDVLIAFFGGLAGILATSSKLKGNVIPGVAIATALMPPLCTAGYGLATLQFHYFFGAIYLFLINSVFISLATLVTTRLLKFPFVHLPRIEDEARAKHIVWIVVVLTLLPSIYFGYDIVQQNKFMKNASRFIEYEASFPNNYLLNKKVDPKIRSITLTYGGEVIPAAEIDKLEGTLNKYSLAETTLKIQQGFAYLKSSEKLDNPLTSVVADKEKQIARLQTLLDSISDQKLMSKQIYNELKAQYSSIESAIIQPVKSISDSAQNVFWICSLKSNKTISAGEEEKIADWLSVRLNTKNVQVTSQKVKGNMK